MSESAGQVVQYIFFFRHESRVVDFGPYPNMQDAMRAFQRRYGYWPNDSIRRVVYGTVTAKTMTDHYGPKFIVCDGCGESFDDLQVAWEHDPESSGFADCEDKKFTLKPESEAM